MLQPPRLIVPRMSLLSLKLAPRDEKGRYSSKHTYAKKIIVSASFIALISIGAFYHEKLRGDAWHYKSTHTADGISRNEKIGGRDTAGCTRRGAGAFDCTDATTRAKVYEAAKKGIKWYTKPETNEEKLEAVCQSKGISDTDCPRILKAMSMQESGFGKWMVGDNSRSHGWFHILNIHKDVSLKCALDISCSASWTLSRMIRNGYAQNKWHAVGTHNSYTPSVGAAYAKAVKKQLAKM